MKRKRLILFAVISLVFVGIVSTNVSAADSGVRSRGNLVLDNGQIAIHAADIDYLQSEVEALFRELPSESNN